MANQDAQEGKKPHFVNKCWWFFYKLKLKLDFKKTYLPNIAEQKILELAEKYKELKKNGKVEKFLAKKGRNNSQKIANNWILKENIHTFLKKIY